MEHFFTKMKTPQIALIEMYPKWIKTSQNSLQNKTLKIMPQMFFLNIIPWNEMEEIQIHKKKNLNQILPQQILRIQNDNGLQE